MPGWEFGGSGFELRVRGFADQGFGVRVLGLGIPVLRRRFGVSHLGFNVFKFEVWGLDLGVVG